MPAFIVEDGTIVPEATSYVTVAEADDYLSIKSNAADWTALADGVVQNYLMWATRILDQRAVFPNSTPTEPDNQSLRWPRQYAYDREGDLIPDDVIPDQIKEATIEIAFNLFDQGIDPSSGGSSGSAGGAIKRIKAAVVEIEYTEGVSATTSAFPTGINDILYPLGSIAGVGGSRGVPIRRA